MLIETIGKYQVHLIARSISSAGPWVPYVVIERFDERLNDFICVMEKHRIGDGRVFETENDAFEEARRYAASLLPLH
jgi:hypothetical protein